MDTFWRAFFPLFVAVDVFGSVPIFLSFMSKVPDPRRRRIVAQAVATAFGISIVFLFAGKGLFSILGISADDFRIGGGLVLLVLAVTELVLPDRPHRNPGESSVGVVPLGTPLIIGPAALTTILILLDRHGAGWTLASLLANLALVWVVFSYASGLSRVLGTAGLKALSKVIALFLAAIAVMMIRLGILGVARAAGLLP